MLKFLLSWSHPLALAIEITLRVSDSPIPSFRWTLGKVNIFWDFACLKCFLFCLYTLFIVLLVMKFKTEIILLLFFEGSISLFYSFIELWSHFAILNIDPLHISMSSPHPFNFWNLVKLILVFHILKFPVICLSIGPFLFTLLGTLSPQSRRLSLNYIKFYWIVFWGSLLFLQLFLPFLTHS